jgi:hypothetical protein
MLEDNDRRLDLTVADVPAHVEEREGFPVIVTDRPLEPSVYGVPASCNA